MDVIVTGLGVSFLSLAVLVMLFRYERGRGARILPTFRDSLDRGVESMHLRIERISWFLGRECIRQVFHYLFHSSLRIILIFLRRCELGLKNMMRVNKTLAKSVERQNNSRTKLEEIALHKVASALTEEEKKIRRDKELRGH